MTPAPEGDFYEDDEPIEKILAAWDEGEKGLTGPPVRTYDCAHLTVSGPLTNWCCGICGPMELRA